MESLGDVVPILSTTSRAERATLRAAREMARRHAELQGRLARIELKDGLAITTPELESLTTCHRGATRLKIDWNPIAARAPVQPPPRMHEREKVARRTLATYQATWQERMFGDEAQRRRQLTHHVLEAARDDEMAYRAAYQAAQTYNVETQMARRLLEFEIKAVKEAVAMKTRLAEVRDGLNGFALAQPGGGRIVALVDAIQEGDVPYERITDGDQRTARRELIPAGERRQIHLAALCAAGLRVGADLVSILPADAVEVVVGCETPSPGGGRPQPPQPVIQLLMTAKALIQNDWIKADAVTLATKLGARMDWSIENGFAPIRLVTLSSMGKPLAA